MISTSEPLGDLTQVLARGSDFTLARVCFGHIAVVGPMRDGLDVALAMANVDLVPTVSRCLIVDCSASDYDARTIGMTVLDWVLGRASLTALHEVWLLPTEDLSAMRSTRLDQRVAER